MKAKKSFWSLSRKGQISRLNPFNCCFVFTAACLSGTDNQGFGPLIDVYEGSWVIGTDIEMKYCPWCGKRVSKLVKEFNEAKGRGQRTK